VIILQSHEIREWDQYTIRNEPVASIDLMERAAGKCAEWILQQNWQHRNFKIFCGKGNNGGDGLAIARMLLNKGYQVSIYILEFGKLGTPDFQTNLQRLHELPLASIHFIQTEEHFPHIETDDVVIDAVFGSGLNKPLTGLTASLVKHINAAHATVISIDLPSGLSADTRAGNDGIIKADHTLTFQCYKPALLVQENGVYAGNVHLLDIGLHPGFLEGRDFAQNIITKKFIQSFLKKRNPFAHKGSFGHALLMAGSYGKMGAAVLAAKACTRSGAGLVTAYLPRCGYHIMQTAVPEVMVMTDQHEEILTSAPDDLSKYSAIGIGPGIGTSKETVALFSNLQSYGRPVVVDADGMNILAQHQELLSQLPALSVLTPHPKEFDRLFGTHQSDFDRIQKAGEQSVRLGLVIVLKGHHTLVSTPDGKQYFNITGNAGMAKGGSGDVLTGIITSLMAQGYEPVQASLLGVWLHGAAGDRAAQALSQEAMLPTDIITFLSQAFLELRAQD